MHCLAPGVQDPEHAPPLHTLVHTVPFCHAPFESQVWGVSPLHCLVPGVHSPVHAPPRHTWPVHETPAPHWPVPLHV